MLVKNRHFTNAGMDQLANASTEAIPDELRTAALQCLVEADPVQKVREVRALALAWGTGALYLDVQADLAETQPIPGRPEKPELVAPRLVKRRAMQTVEGRAILIHALAHIEFNAINLALDAIWRFSDMPPAYYSEWLAVASEEALHFSLLVEHLSSLGFAYGDFPAHNYLWDMAEMTRHDILARIALVPRTIEARGLDATPALRAKLAQAGDMAAAKILDIILRDEIGHVSVGNRWYGWLCRQRSVDPVDTYRLLVQRYKAPALKSPINWDARRLAGFSEKELLALQKELE